MPRVRRESNEESSIQGIHSNTSTANDEPLVLAKRESGDIYDGVDSRLLDGTVLRRCVLCHEEFTKEDFVPHIRSVHPSYRGPRNAAGNKETKDICGGACVWVCSVCKRETYFQSDGRVHGGPTTRLIDRRFGLHTCRGSRYGDGHKRSYGKIDGGRGPVVFYHMGTPNPEQPVQDDPTLAVFLQEKPKREKSIQGEANTKTSRKRIARTD